MFTSMWGGRRGDCLGLMSCKIFLKFQSHVLSVCCLTVLSYMTGNDMIELKWLNVDYSDKCYFRTAVCLCVSIFSPCEQCVCSQPESSGLVDAFVGADERVRSQARGWACGVFVYVLADLSGASVGVCVCVRAGRGMRDGKLSSVIIIPFSREGRVKL